MAGTKILKVEKVTPELLEKEFAEEPNRIVKSTRILKNKTKYTVQIYNQSVSDHTVNFATKEVYDKFKSQSSDELFLKEDVLDAVDLLKGEISVYTRTNNLVLNKQMRVLLKRIKEIFPDLYE